MKIAILTLPFHANYGGVLQAYALQTVLQRMGHEVVVIDKDMFHHRSWFRQQLSFSAYIVRKYLLGKECEYSNSYKADHDKKAVEKNIRSFINKHLNILTVKDLAKDFPRDTDAVVVGSDQVWRPKYFTWAYGCGIENAYLSFLDEPAIKKVSFAASFGTEKWEYSDKETDICSYFLKRFYAVSVRESSGVRLCQERLGRTDVEQMPDPAFLLTKNDYRSLFERKDDPVHYLLYYVLDETEDSITKAETIAKNRGLTIKRINGDIDNPSIPISKRIKAPVEEWLRGVANADFVFTDSFHACVFSIIFEKPFVSIGNHNRGMDRFNSLSALFRLDDNTSVLNEQRERAFRFLSKALDCKQ